MANNSWYPSDFPELSTEANYAIRQVYQNVYDLRGQVGSLGGSLTSSQMSQIQSGLSAGGSNPLNVTNLSGNLTIVNGSSQNLADKPRAPASGQLYRNSYFGRVWQWNGNGWSYFDGSLGAGGIVAVRSGGPAPSGGLWQLCDGSTVTGATDGCSLTNLTTPTPGTVSGLSWWMRR